MLGSFSSLPCTPKSPQSEAEQDKQTESNYFLTWCPRCCRVHLLGLACFSPSVILLTGRWDLPDLQQSQHISKSLSVHLPLPLFRRDALPAASRAPCLALLFLPLRWHLDFTEHRLLSSEIHGKDKKKGENLLCCCKRWFTPLGGNTVQNNHSPH